MAGTGMIWQEPQAATWLYKAIVIDEFELDRNQESIRCLWLFL
jgi:hypothetical protein